MDVGRTDGQNRRMRPRLRTDRQTDTTHRRTDLYDGDYGQTDTTDRRTKQTDGQTDATQTTDRRTRQTDGHDEADGGLPQFLHKCLKVRRTDNTSETDI